MRHRNGERNLHGGDRAILDRGYGLARRGDRWLPDRWMGMPGQIVTPPGGGLADGDPVTTWVDSSGKGHDASQTGSARPTFKTNILNGKPVVRFTAAGSSSLNIPAVSSVNPWTCFVVMKPLTPTSVLISLGADIGGGTGPLAPSFIGDGKMFCQNRSGYRATISTWAAAVHVFTAVFGTGGGSFVDGTDNQDLFHPLTANADFTMLGYRGTSFGDGDIAEIIFYSGELALRAKLLLVLTALITTGQIPSTAEADALLAAGDLVALEAYLIEHGVPVEQARDTLEPMAVGDRANIEKYLGTKYGITVAGGTAADPSTVAGLLGWWKADSLAAVVTPPPGLNDGDPVALWADSSGNGHDASNTGSARPTFKTNIINGKPVVRYSQASGQVLNLSNTTGMGTSHPWSSFVVMKYNVANTNLLVLINSSFASFTFQYRNAGGGQMLAADNAGSGFNTTPAYSGAFHIFSTETVSAQTPIGWVDGTSVPFTGGAGGGLNPFSLLGFGDGDIAEVIHYSGTIAIRAKLLLVLTVLVTTGEIPSTAEADALFAVGDLVGLEAYLIQHGVPVEQARDTLEPMAVGDRANIEKYLGTKYGITVAGGTAVDPSTVAGLVGWWKADSLL